MELKCLASVIYKVQAFGIRSGYADFQTRNLLVWETVGGWAAVAGEEGINVCVEEVRVGLTGRRHSCCSHGAAPLPHKLR